MFCSILLTMSEMLIWQALKSLFWSVLLWVARLHIIRKLREPHVTTLLINCNPSVVSIPCHNKSSCVRFPNLNVSQAMHKLEWLLPKDPRIELGPKNTIITASSIKKTKKYILYWNIHWISSNESKQRTLKCFYFSKQCDLYVHCMKRNSLPYNDLPTPPTHPP